AFRKHQKAVFAGLTIICMLTFVLASGVSGLGRDAGGDFFSEVTRWFGGRGRTTGVAKLYAGRVEQAQITLLRAQRRTANSYMASAIVLAHNNLFDKVFDALSYNKERKESERQSLFRARQQAFGYSGAGEQYQFLADFTRKQYFRQLQQ